MAETLTEVSLLEEMFDALPDIIIWRTPVFENGELVDFTVSYVNAIGQEHSGQTKEEMMGKKTLADGLPSPSEAKEVFAQCAEIFSTGEAKEFKYYSSKLGYNIYALRKPFKNGVLTITRDKRFIQAIESQQEQAQLLESIIKHAPVGVVVYTSLRNAEGEIVDFKIRLYNQKINELTGFTNEDRSKYTLKQLLKGTGVEGNFERYAHTVETGEPFTLEFYMKKTSKWLLFNGVKMGDGFVSIVSDVTEKRHHEEAITHQTTYLNNVFNTSLIPIITMEGIRNEQNEIVDLKYLQVNKAFTEMLDINEAEIVGKGMIEFFPYTKTAGIFDMYKRVIETGEPIRKEIYYNDGKIIAWYNISASKLDSNTIVCTFNDVTKGKEALLEIEKQKSLLDNIMKFSPSGISVTEVIKDDTGKVIDGRTIIANEAAIKHVGLPEEEYLSKTANEIDPTILSSPLYQKTIEALETGEPFHTQYFIEVTKRWIELSVAKMDDYHLINIFTDITNSKKAQLEIERSADMLRTVVDTAQAGMFTIEPKRDEAGEIIDFRFVIINSAVSKLVNKTSEELSGKLVSSYFPSYKESGVFDMYKNCFETGKKHRKDIHYNVDGHDKFLDVQSVKIGNEVLVTFTDYTTLKKLQLQLESYVEELKRSNANLEEFAYAASHDLQEPLRKINFFAEKLKSSASSFSEQDKNLFDRMMAATGRMRQLIDDLLKYSQVNRKTEPFAPVDLNNTVEQALVDLEASIHEKNAIVEVKDLPIVQGDAFQLHQAIQNLLSNALKYTKDNITPHITITSRETIEETVNGKIPFHLVEITDNGIGFAQEHAEQIFKVFQRLHGRSEYPGTGVGLAIVRKVAEMHHGFIKAESEPGKGATFKWYIPA